MDTAQGHKIVKKDEGRMKTAGTLLSSKYAEKYSSDILVYEKE